MNKIAVHLPTREQSKQIMEQVYMIDPNPREATLLLYLRMNHPFLVPCADHIWGDRCPESGNVLLGNIILDSPSLKSSAENWWRAKGYQVPKEDSPYNEMLSAYIEARFKEV